MSSLLEVYGPAGIIVVAIAIAVVVFLPKGGKKAGIEPQAKPKRRESIDKRSKRASSEKMTSTGKLSGKNDKVSKAEQLKARKDKLAAKLKEREETLMKLSALQGNLNCFVKATD